MDKGVVSRETVVQCLWAVEMNLCFYQQIRLFGTQWLSCFPVVQWLQQPTNVTLEGHGSGYLLLSTINRID